MGVERAIVLIGVRRTGDLPELQAVESGVDAMAGWARDQGIPDDRVVEVSDRGGQPVTAAAVTTAIAELVARPTLQQLVVYFAGHGINNGQSEYWLLSGAPANPNEAVNLAGSAALAERLAVPHVVFVSDACRTAPMGIQAMGVTGSVVVPNLPPSGPASTVDQFYACLLGSPANEIADKDQAASVYRSLYTEVLVEALQGEHADLLEPEPVAAGAAAAGSEPPASLVRPWPLKRGLSELTLERLVASGDYLTINQQPDARVTSDPAVAWLSRVATPAPGRGPVTRGPGRVPTRGPRPVGVTSVAEQVGGAVADVLDGRDPRRRPRGERPPAAFLDGVEELATGHGPGSFESGCGVKVRGGEVVGARAIGGTTELLEPTLVRIWPDGSGAPGGPGDTAGPVVLVGTSAGVVVAPTLRGFFVGLTFRGDDLADVAWEPMVGTPAGDEWEARADVRDVRAALATAVSLGADPVGADRVDDLVTWGMDALRLDPSIALHLARFLRDIGRRDAAVEVRNRVVEVFGVTFADLEVLADAPIPGAALAPALPLMSRTWPTWDALASPHPAPGLSVARLPSTWVLYRDDALADVVAVVEAAAAAPVVSPTPLPVPPGPS